jgi:hypothetical protein
MARFHCTNLPQMTYRVGDNTTDCPMTAEKLAADHHTQVHYVVGKKAFADKSEANKAYADALDNYFDDMLTVRYAVGNKSMKCGDSAKSIAKKEGTKVNYQLASFRFEDRESAEKAAKTAREAADQVTMKLVVGEKTYSCPMQASHVAKQHGEKVSYCVGDSKTTCEDTARIQVATERIRTALVALEQNGGQLVSDI